MERRKFMIGVGSLAAGGAAAISTGAFTSVSATRSVSVTVTGDAQAYLSLESQGSRATQAGNGELELDFSSSGNGASGLNPDARTAFLNVFSISNQGEDDVVIGIVKSDSAYEDPSMAPSLIADVDGIDTAYVYNEPETGPGTGGSGLSASGGGTGVINIDSGGRVILKSRGNVFNAIRLSPGESVFVDFTFITNNQLGNFSAKMPIVAVQPGSSRDETT
ncbi:hypothetical protein ACFQFH_04580 [Halobaculum halobium]|uniref:DUF1102 domain-containing protein n=2 Tax=Halobaculum halobium TaxID=3032281 RepID=A0ABD5T7G2_9EURY|nr:hypothetical protein [Halobaculum sp. SYNS20]